MLQVTAENHSGWMGQNRRKCVCRHNRCLVCRHVSFGFCPTQPEWFSAIACNIWLRLEYRPLDSAWFVCPQLLYFRPRNPFLEPRIPDLDPGGFRLGWGPFLLKQGCRENMILWWKWPPMGFEGDLCEGIGSYGTQEAFGQARFPPNPL